jgi:hypothetical protein
MLDAQRRTVFDMAAESVAAALRGSIALLLVAYLGQPKGDLSRLALPPGKSP